MVVRVQDSFAYRVHMCARALRRDLLKILAKADTDLSPEQWFVLNKLVQKDGQSQVELGAQLLADRPNMSRIIGGLVTRQWAHKRADIEDARRQRVYISADGRRAHDRVAGMVPDARVDLFDGISEADMQAAFRVIDRIEQNMKAQDS